ncbi:MAG: hypothetical protein K6A36_06395 [Paludibacteraceae bacterium]|nr:hypothetical protein [Paludibacteraceae bacterium]
MNILFVTGHPAQVHNFRNVRAELIRDGHRVFWLTTPKDIATNLLETYDIPYIRLQKAAKSAWSRMRVMIHNTILVIRTIFRNHIDVCVTRTDPYTAIAAWICRVPNIMLQDTEHAATSRLQGPFARFGSAYLEPECFAVKVREDELRFPGNIELFYVHPKRFSASSIWNLLQIAPNTRYAIVRFVKWDAFHDANLVGGFSLDQKRQLVQRLSKHLRVFISSESELPADLEPYRIRIPIEHMHDVQASATLFVGESATMASESVVMGTPAIYIDEVGRGYTDEEAREQLLWMYRPVANRKLLKSEPSWISGGVEECIEKAVELAAINYDSKIYAQRHKEWMRNKIDCTAFLTWFIENYPESVQKTREADETFWQHFK